MLIWACQDFVLSLQLMFHVKHRQHFSDFLNLGINSSCIALEGKTGRGAPEGEGEGVTDPKPQLNQVNIIGGDPPGGLYTSAARARAGWRWISMASLRSVLEPGLSPAGRIFVGRVVVGFGPGHPGGGRPQIWRAERRRGMRAWPHSITPSGAPAMPSSKIRRVLPSG